MVATEAVYGWLVVVSCLRGCIRLGRQGQRRRWQWWQQRVGAYAMMWGLGCGWSKTSLLLSYLLLLSRRRRLIVDHVVVGLQHERAGVGLLVQHRLRDL